MPRTPAQQVLDQTQSTAFMRGFYASLGLSKLTLERAIQQSKGLAATASTPLPRPRPGPGRPRRSNPR
jgi:hypothetical protein